MPLNKATGNIDDKLRDILKNLVEGITAGYTVGLDFETYPEENYEYAITRIKKVILKENLRRILK